LGSTLRAGAWPALAAVLALGALVAWTLPHDTLDWQPTLAASEPWRAWTAAFVHYSPLHLGANLAGCVAVGALGHAGRVPPRVALAWLLAWPLTHLGLLAEPALRHYGGLSGVLHAGVATVALHLLFDRAPRRRTVGLAIVAGLIAKLLVDAPWNGPLQHPAGWDIAVAPLAHVGGALAGALCMVVLEAWAARRTTTIAR
jgi:rhomboid family GlyGly-CTERM serine protease